MKPVNEDCNNSPDRQAQPSRVERLKSWMALNKWKNVQVADKLGCDATTVSNLIHGRRVTKKHVDGMIGLGFPADLLPEIPEPRKPGPKPKAQTVGDAA